MLVLRASHANGERGRERKGRRDEGGGILRGCVAFRPSFPPSSSALLEESQQRMTTGGGGGTLRLEQMNCDAPSELAPSKIRYLKIWHVIDLIQLHAYTDSV